MSRKIRAAVVGYGNIGKFVVEALQVAPDFDIAGIVRRDASNVPAELEAYEVVSHVSHLKSVDVAILCVPTRKVEAYAIECLELGINTVDGFDIHGQIVPLRASLDQTAKRCGAVSILSAGWDPGSDSVIRALFEAMAPQGITYTNFGPGMSMGHTVAVKTIDGVKDALSVTLPIGKGVHRRMVYVELREGHDFEEVAQAIKSDAYFVNDETHVLQVEDVEPLKDKGHGVRLERKGSSGVTPNQLFTFDMRVNNPALTAQVMVVAARAAGKQRPGAYTMIEIPVVDLLPGEKEAWIKQLV
ncbi:MAG: diaminopimelate dehydrogenase [Fermentimonas sp.]|jgi:diaminopimelate dehydrogenase